LRRRDAGLQSSDYHDHCDHAGRQFRHHARHRVGGVVQPDRLACDVAFAGKLPAPQPLANHRDRMGARRFILVCRECAANDGPDAKRRKIIVADEADGNALSALADQEIGRHRRERRNPGEHVRRLTAVIHVIRVRVIARALASSVSEENGDQFLRFFCRERSE